MCPAEFAKSDEAARVAVRHGRNATIDNTARRIRCEPAKVNRTLVLMKHDGSVASKAEVEKLIFGFGNYEALEFSEDESYSPGHALTQGPRCFVRFTLRQDAVDCYQVISHSCTRLYFLRDATSISAFMPLGVLNGRTTSHPMVLFP